MPDWPVVIVRFNPKVREAMGPLVMGKGEKATDVFSTVPAEMIEEEASPNAVLTGKALLMVMLELEFDPVVAL